MAETTPTTSLIREIQIEALVAMRIIKHSTSSFPTPATGCLVGMDVPASTANTTSTSTSATQLQITNCFPYPASVPEPNAQTDGYYQQQDAASLAAAAPRAKSNVGYQNEMVKLLREVNVDAQVVGWYISANMGSFVNLNFVENQAFFQRQEEGAGGAAGGAGRLAVGVVFDVGRSVSGSLSLKAYRLGEKFMVAWREGKFTTESIQKSNLRYQDILIEIPIQIHNSHLLTSYLHQLPTPAPSKTALDFPTSLSQLSHDPSLTPTPLNPNLETLDLSIDPFLERTTDNLLDSIEAHQIELNNAQYYQRSLAREQAKIQAWQTKRKQENVLRVQQKQTPLDEGEWTKLFKLPTEPSRLEGMLVGRQVEQYGRMVDGFSAGVSGKMFAVRGGLVPGDAN